MDCPNCKEIVEPGAAYCGNCGQSLKSSVSHLGSAGIEGAAPGAGYAAVTPMQHRGEMQALASLLLGIIGLAGTLFVPVVGLCLGLAGIILGTISRHYVKKVLHIAGLVLSCLALFASLAAWTYAVRSDPRVNPSISRADPLQEGAEVANSVATPCYSFSFVDELNIETQDNSCDIKAFNGSTIEGSTNAYKVYASKTSAVSANEFTNLVKPAIEKDILQYVPNYKVAEEKVTSFAGSPAYSVTAISPDAQVSLTEAAVLHKTAAGYNVFVLVHANTGPSANLQIMESQWQWK